MLDLPLFWILFRKLFPTKEIVLETIKTILKPDLRPYIKEEAKKDLKNEVRLFLFLMTVFLIGFGEFLVIMKLMVI